MRERVKSEEVKPNLGGVVLGVIALIASDIPTANSPDEEGIKEGTPQSKSIVPMDVGLELLKENTPESMHNIIDGAAMIVSPVKSVKQIVDGISDGLGIVAKKGDVVSDGLKKIDGNVPEANSNGNTLLESGRCSGVFCNGEQVPDVGQDVDVEFSFTRNQSRHDADEFIDQGFDQGAGLSNRPSGEA
jgi:hypothetical protein